MPRYSYERLSAQDNTFLLMEDERVKTHVAATLIFETGDLLTPEGGIDIRRYKLGVEAALHLIPRYRQRLRWIPGFGRPVWVDDRRFNLDYHIRHTSLPRPGNLEQLKQLSARIMAQSLDRTKPLWEMWVVEGLQDDRFAVVNKVHHCMIDGSSGVDLAQILMSPSPESDVHETVPYIPRPAPSGNELLADELLRTVTLPLQAWRSLRNLRATGENVAHEIETRGRALLDLAGLAVRSPSETPLNGPLGSHRRFDWLDMPLDEVKRVRKALGCTVNDIVLATVSGAVRRYLLRRRVNPDPLDFRVSAPVSVRRAEEQGQLGNRVSSWILSLPLDEGDPLRRVARIHEVTRELKESNQALGVETMMAVAEWTPSILLTLGSRAASGPINMIVTNVPGPQFPLYMLGSKLLAMYPQVPLLAHTGVGVALFSYDGTLFWGFNADYDLVPDLRYFVESVEVSFQEIRDAAGPKQVELRPTAAKPPSKRSPAKPSKARGDA